jgi:hypothetical protein
MCCSTRGGISIACGITTSRSSQPQPTPPPPLLLQLQLQLQLQLLLLLLLLPLLALLPLLPLLPLLRCAPLSPDAFVPAPFFFSAVTPTIPSFISGLNATTALHIRWFSTALITSICTRTAGSSPADRFAMFMASVPPRIMT